ncbi:MAG: 5'-nucleotidase C-terminal domain-containing protein [Peptococcaceae bacterium]|nr:5'-nucleotidase C-terminal domain-containing protein [Peptococcaceae bacterium]
MKHYGKKVLSMVLAGAMLCSSAAPVFAANENTAADADDIVVLYTNDIHCTNDEGMAYAAIAGYKAQMEDAIGADNVTLVDNGDAIQGAVLGTLSDGEWIVDIMNEVGYDLAIPGNHEFDFGMDQFLDIANNQADYQYLSCNFVDKDGTAVLDPYAMVTYGDTDIAYIGISTPETLSKSTPAFFQDENGNYIYGFCQGENGQELYDRVQDTVDAARADGADYVVALAHLGEDLASRPWMSTEVIANTTGIDAVLDGHSHTVDAEQIVKNADGEDVVLSQTGTKAESIGQLTIDPATGEMSTQLVKLADVATDSPAYTAAQTYIQGIQEKYQDVVAEVVATSDVTLTVSDPATGDRRVRSAETNMGDFCADAYREVMGADIGFVNGGGVRADIKAGDVTYGDIIAVHPFGNMACLAEVSGQQILDALELGSMYVGTAESGGFLQVSGLKYTINTQLPSSVVVDDTGAFVEVSGARRVSDVQVENRETGAYEPLDPAATYTLASHNYMLKQGGDGFTMFGEDNIKLLLDETMVDNEVLIDYLTENLDGVIGETYADPYGQGRITINNEPVEIPEEPTGDLPFIDVDPDSWYYGAVEYAYENGLMNGVAADQFAPQTTLTRAMMAAVLANLENGSANTSGSFNDVADGAWYADAVNWAAENGIVNGYEDGTFRPDAPLTREQMAAFLYNYAAYKGYDVSATNDLAQFSDAAQVSSWAADVVKWAVGADLLHGVGDDKLAPTGTATRAEVAAILANFCENVADLGADEDVAA